MGNPYQPTDPTDASKAAASLTSLPSLEDTHEHVKAVIEQVGQQISALAPAVTWSWRREESRGGCNPPYEQSDGHQILIANYVSDVPIPEQNWPQAYDIARRAAAGLGDVAVTVFKDAPNDHDVQFSTETGTTLRLGSQKAALLSGGTGCRLSTSKPGP
ncbi:LppA family lipoprotein [Candidatus Mycolicibacterium alkanivorans]|uniref:LppA family lipoprotein n=1 Tax=Candidatus Mycolicibacterium alkanivorans TaxID=2954114 RepID=A0ABS9YWX5_9MYCO|nr:LppA family lipoprotein [Candidatus Mycolicibacterium alkanivorans]MCI4675632.1 LppA family lipoprotein [Candidatus Mycolicibacterium alkanivorans]